MNRQELSHSNKLPPIHPGETLNEEFLLPMKITQSRLASAIGVDARRIRAIVHGQRSITAETALLLSRFFGNSAQFWMGLQSQYALLLSRFFGNSAQFWMGLQSQYDLETAEDALSQKLSLVTPHVS